MTANTPFFSGNAIRPLLHSGETESDGPMAHQHPMCSPLMGFGDPPGGNGDAPDTHQAHELLHSIDQQIDQVVLSRQHPISGLLPASTASTVHGNYADAWVRDNIYSIQCVWGLALAHRRLRGECRRAFELEQRVKQLMRGLMRAMMRQSEKVEKFKLSLQPLDAIHAKFDTSSGDTVVPDDAWGHLQLDATALFLLQLAQLTRSGLVIVQTSHERDFIQNLVYCVARAYRVADYGIWERGDKGNQGLPERNASSIGMVKAALEALEGLDLYGPHGDGSCCLSIPHDAVVRLRRALDSLLPRESAMALAGQPDRQPPAVQAHRNRKVDNANLRSLMGMDPSHPDCRPGMTQSVGIS
jgi:phosphorylase kinase alpha/beta subunit